MASADSPRDGLRSTIIISSDAEMDEHQPPARKLRRKRPRTDYSYPVYEALFDDPAPSEMRQPPKKRKIPNLDAVLETANQGIHNIFEAEHAKREALEEEVQHLRAEITRKNGLVDRLETEVRTPPAQQSTLPVYCAVLGDILQKVPFQTYASDFSSKTAAPLNVPPERLSVDRTSNNQPQPPGGIEPDGWNNISDSGATTEPLAHDELENLPYWYGAQQVEKSLKIYHVGDKGEGDATKESSEHITSSTINTQLTEDVIGNKTEPHAAPTSLRSARILSEKTTKTEVPCGVSIPEEVSSLRSEIPCGVRSPQEVKPLGNATFFELLATGVKSLRDAITSVEKATKLKAQLSDGFEFIGCTRHVTHYIFVWWWKVAVRSIRLVKINRKVPVVFMDEEVDALAATVIKVATQHTLECAFPSVTHLHKAAVHSPWLLDTL
ncbi:predicted protein [Histoplasma mississippiense (nom. inval.)]|uniref:predicted protein n=1 Tax=Ajellomyces capsulatus (strain NAm1 / WU24) TaxID=2059318 RepID=UPI000157B8F3|nr:predicted protein [Histoplasma mississippiense (nom. inval.)]EDN03761.1 predicted protein [Histoplasma mississippiense (nom. inval.)]